MYIKKVEDKDVNGTVRAHRLNDGDVFTVKDLTVQYEDMVLYEVVFSGYDGFMQSIWTKTGRIYTIDELNQHCK